MNETFLYLNELNWIGKRKTFMWTLDPGFDIESPERQYNSLAPNKLIFNTEVLREKSRRDSSFAKRYLRYAHRDGSWNNLANIFSVLTGCYGDSHKVVNDFS